MVSGVRGVTGDVGVGAAWRLLRPAVPAVASAFLGGELAVRVSVAPCRCSWGRSLFEVPWVSRVRGRLGFELPLLPHVRCRFTSQPF